MDSFVAKYQELALKGKNRPWFIDRLLRHLEHAMAGLPVADVRCVMGRIEVSLVPGSDPDPIGARLAKVFGLANFSRAGRAPLDLDAITAAILGDIGPRRPRSFRVVARRADKRFPVPSPEIERIIGGHIKQATGWPVDLDNPDLVVRVETLTDSAFYFFGKEKGPGGLPTGTAGRVAALLSGGIDSPVAAWRMMKRGCRVTFVHFHSYPILSRASQEKARELVKILTEYQLQSRLFLVPFGELQQQIVLAVPAPLRVVVYRRLMLRIAEQIARRNRCQGLVTGEVVGQVASQTLENLSVIASAARLPIFRPLIGMDKEEITTEAIRLATYPVSIIPDQDCCTLFTPKHPVTRSRLKDIEAAELALPTAEMVERAVAATTLEEYRFPVLQSAGFPSPGASVSGPMPRLPDAGPRSAS